MLFLNSLIFDTLLGSFIAESSSKAACFTYNSDFVLLKVLQLHSTNASRHCLIFSKSRYIGLPGHALVSQA